MVSNISLAHCVSADFGMKHGLALQMRRKIGNVAQMRRLQKRVTEVASLETANRPYSISLLWTSFVKSQYMQISLKPQENVQRVENKTTCLSTFNWWSGQTQMRNRLDHGVLYILRHRNRDKNHETKKIIRRWPVSNHSINGKGNVFILTFQNELSKFAWAVPMENHEAKHCCVPFRNAIHVPS